MVQEGWLICDGIVLASARSLDKPRSLLVSSGALGEELGAVVVCGPALVLGTALARLGPDNRVRIIEQPGLRLVGPRRRAVVLTRSIAEQVHLGNPLEFRFAA